MLPMEIPIFVCLTIIEGSAFEHVAKKNDFYKYLCCLWKYPFLSSWQISKGQLLNIWPRKLTLDILVRYFQIYYYGLKLHLHRELTIRKYESKLSWTLFLVSTWILCVKMKPEFQSRPQLLVLFVNDLKWKCCNK